MDVFNSDIKTERSLDGTGVGITLRQGSGLELSFSVWASVVLNCRFSWSNYRCNITDKYRFMNFEKTKVAGVFRSWRRGKCGLYDGHGG